MPKRHRLPIELHTGDCLTKARALKGRSTGSGVLPLLVAILVTVGLAALLPR